MIPTWLAVPLLKDPFVTDVLNAVRNVGPEGGYVAAGFVRNRVWDSLYEGQCQYSDADIDVVYFDEGDATRERDAAYDAALEAALPCGPWQVSNQARMHHFGGHPPFESLEHGLSHWAETATTVGVRLSADGTLEGVAPFGYDDLFGHILRITPKMKRHDPDGFNRRLQAKGWLERWPNLIVIRD